MGLFEPDERHCDRDGQAAVGASRGRAPARRHVLVVHSLTHARAAAAVSARRGVPLTIATAPGAGGYLGPAWFGQVLGIATSENPNARLDGVFDCGDQAGCVMAALRYGLKRIRFDGTKRQRARLIGLAAAYGAEIVTGPADTFDLLHEDEPEAAIGAWLDDRGG